MIAALGVLVTTIGGVATSVIVAWKANAKAGEAVAKAAEATGKADGAQLSVGRLSNRSNEQDRAISTLEMASPPPTSTPAPKPRRVSINGKLFEGVLTEVCEESERIGK